MKKLSLVVIALLLCVAAMAIGGGPNTYKEKEKAIQSECAMAQNGYGAGASGAQNSSTPEIKMVSTSPGAPGSGAAPVLGCLKPDAAGQIIVKGSFPIGTKFVVEDDDVQVLSQSLVGNEAHLAVKVASGAMPGNFHVAAFAPRSCLSDSRSGVIITGQVQYDLVASNGWKIQMVNNPDDANCSGNNANKKTEYKIKYSKGNDPKPFLDANTTYQFNSSSNEARFELEYMQAGNVTQPNPADAQNIQLLAMKLMDPKLSPADRNKIMAQLQQSQTQLKQAATANSQVYKAMAADQQFTCRNLYLHSQGGVVNGRLDCNGNPANITVTGTVKNLSK